MSEAPKEDARVTRERELLNPVVRDEGRTAREFAATVLAQEFEWTTMSDYLAAVRDLAHLIAYNELPENKEPVPTPTPTEPDVIR